MKLLFFILAGFILTSGTGNGYTQKKNFPAEPLPVKKCQDFDITGTGNNAEWGKAAWVSIKKLDTGGTNYESKFKIMYSSTGIYLLFEGEDQKITTIFDKDFQDLYKGDVFEVFFHPDTSIPLYFEYEINHLEKELVLLIPNLKGRVSGWIPTHYENERKIKKMVNIVGGKAEMGAVIKSWSAELFFPFRLLNAFGNTPPARGTTWNANFYRLDYDSGKMIKYSWMPIDHSFHEFEKFKPIKFE